MSVISVLRDEYPGDPAWKKFVAVFQSEWDSATDKELYLAAISDAEIAVVLAGAMGAGALEWFKRPCRALDNRVPFDVLSGDPGGSKIVRTLLMRMPL